MIIAAGGPTLLTALLNLLPPALFIISLVGIVLGIYILILVIQVLRLSIQALKEYLQ